jgi:hypothetical protein
MSDNTAHEVEEKETSPEEVAAYLDLARDIALFPETDSPESETSEEAKAGLTDLLTRAKSLIEGEPANPDREGATVGGGIRANIGDQWYHLDWHLCIRVVDEETAEAEAVQRALKRAIRETLQGMASGDKLKLADILSNIGSE